MNKSFWGYLEGVLSVIINTALYGLKFWVGVMTGSIAIVADAWHTLSDSLTSVVVILGFKLSSVKPDKKHPFGHGQAELISSVIIATLLGVVGFNFLLESIQRFKEHQAAFYNTIAVIIFLVSVILKEGLAQFSIRVGKKIDSRSLLADGWHHRSDAIASGLILIAMIANKYCWWIDSIMGIFVSLIIIYVALDIIKGSISSLMGEEPEEEFKSKLEQVLIKNSIEVEKVHHVHLHRYGDHLELTFHLRLPANMSLKEAHLIADNLEKNINNEMNIEATIHIEPGERALRHNDLSIK